MINDEKLRRFGFDKIALLILLLAGLFIAKLIVSSRGNFKLSKPVEIQGTGVTVSVPSGGGFAPLIDGFEYNDNEFRLSAGMPINNNAVVKVSWRYFIVPFKGTAAERFEEQAVGIEGAIEKTGSEKLGQLTFDYARIVSEKTSVLLISGTTQLPDGRTLTLEVGQKGPDLKLADKIFRSIAASAVFTPDSPLARGTRLMDNFKNKTLADITGKKPRQNYSYVENYTDQPIGFITDAISVKADKRGTDSLIAANLYFIKVGANSFAEQSLLRCDMNLKNLKWLSRQSDLLISRDIITSIELDKESTVTVRNEKTEKKFGFTSTMIPEILSEILIESFLHSDFNSVMVDMILSDGRVVPTIIARAEMGKNPEPNAVSAVELTFLGDESRQIMYIDSSGSPLLSEVHGKISYKLKKAGRNRLVADFPDWLEKIQEIEQYIFEKKEIKKD